MWISGDYKYTALFVWFWSQQVLADFNSYVVPQPHAQRDHRQDINQHYDYLMEENDEPLGRGAAPNKYRSNHGQTPNRPEISESENYVQTNSESVFSSGETRDFLQFLRRIQYDHRQVPENDKGEATYVEVSVVVSNIRAVSEVTMDMISIILAITFLIFSYNEMMPRVSYIKAMDIYLGVCFMIVFLSLIKLALVKYMRQKIMLTSDSGNSLREMSQMSTRQRLRARKSSSMNFRNNTGTAVPAHEETQQMLTVPTNGDLPNGEDKESNNNKSHISDMLEIRITQRTMHRFHWVSQMLFFFGFVIFCLFYFLIYPNLHIVSVDPACDKNLAEWFAEIF
ncbi:hypothetical protein CAEBREN_00120 [Caenorhabditis brenneri]|uniref:Neurotransmitter-gated ion-channel transmembrane domain-containing protein n=1 Tax=Caenorhabditis brenneri TaxID=135651 RepID=G0MZG6_CAEBE|nr:hypothetical protein CAEBREN_00120 [Caenorhabditis brenneri]